MIDTLHIDTIYSGEKMIQTSPKISKNNILATHIILRNHFLRIDCNHHELPVSHCRAPQLLTNISNPYEDW